MIVGLGCYFSSSGAVPLSRELDPLFRSEVRKPPIRIGRTEHLAGLGAVVWTRGCTRLGSLGKEAVLLGSKLGPCGFSRPTPMLDLWGACVRQADRANHNPPAASSAAIARDRCFAFIVFCFLIQGDVSFTFATALCADFSGVGFRFGTKAGNSGAKRQRAGMNLILSPAGIDAKQVLETFRDREISGSTEIPVFAGFRESDTWWDSSFRSSARPGSRP